jgi:hypothetical protein
MNPLTKYVHEQSTKVCTCGHVFSQHLGIGDICESCRYKCLKFRESKEAQNAHNT